ncbi:Hypothetical protein Minf_0592 [Methylacidiphilum infernorum V4]|uniref:Uncharacterized protein n=1 Tax=Methylacidiphilum infernorum (isolate V4) TaxID=481448 RepID=B3DZY9_METI4|nr:Hypothetical protein Minf_0592 [Methylacidiphilum infernorum V4]
MASAWLFFRVILILGQPVFFWLRPFRLWVNLE